MQIPWLGIQLGKLSHGPLMALETLPIPPSVPSTLTLTPTEETQQLFLKMLGNIDGNFEPQALLHV